MIPKLFFRFLLITFFALVFGSSIGFSQTTLFYESFEAGPLTNNWVVTDLFESDPSINWGIVNSSFGGESTHSGSRKVYCAATGVGIVKNLTFGGVEVTSSTNQPFYANDQATVMDRVIDLTDCLDASLSFWYKIKIPEGPDLFSDAFYVYIDDAPLFDTTFFDTGVSTWTQVILPLRDYVGGEHTLRFEFDSDPSNDAGDPDFDDPPVVVTDFEGAYIDDVLVSVQKNNYVPDYNLDGSSDILFQNTNNNLVAAWHMGPDLLATNAYVASSFLRDKTPIAPGWTIAGHSDFDNNGFADILFQRTNGLLAAWYMTNGGTFVQQARLPSMGGGWRLASITDYDNDGKRDFLLQNKTNQTVKLWRMNRTNVLESILLNGGNPLPFQYNLVGTADFNSDGQKDFLLQKSGGEYLQVWLMSGLNRLSTTVTYISAGIAAGRFPKWKVVELLDFNQDSQTDLLLQHTDGRLAVVYLNGKSVLYGGDAITNHTYSSLGQRVVAVEPGVIYQWTKSVNTDSSTLVNGTTTMTRSGLFAAVGTSVVLNGPANGYVDALLQPITHVIRKGTTSMKIPASYITVGPH